MVKKEKEKTEILKKSLIWNSPQTGSDNLRLDVIQLWTKSTQFLRLKEQFLGCTCTFKPPHLNEENIRNYEVEAHEIK